MRTEIFLDFEAALVTVSLSENSDMETFDEMDGLCLFEKDRLIMQTGETTDDERQFARSWM